MAHIRIDDSQWPFVMLRYPKSFHDGEWREHLAVVETFVRRNEPWGMVNDSRGAMVPNAEQRQLIDDLYGRNVELVKKNWRGTAIIFDSPLVVGAVTALHWLRPLLHPVKSFSDFERGVSWLLARMDPEVGERVRASNVLSRVS